MTRIIIEESERMRVMVTLGEAERHITDDQSSDRHRRARHAINVCQGIFGPGPKATHNLVDALDRIEDALALLQGSSSRAVDAGEFVASANLIAAADSLLAAQELLRSYLDNEAPAERASA